MKLRGSGLLRSIDRYLGIPLLFFLSCFTRKRKNKHSKRIGVLKLAGIGDLILLKAPIEGLRKKNPSSTIVFFTAAPSAAAAELLPVDTTIVLPVNNPLESIRLLREEKLHALYDLESWARISALFSFFSEAYSTYGFSTKGQYRHYPYDYITMHSSNVHEQENMYAMLTVAKEEVKNENTSKKLPYVVFHIFPGGSRATLKEWPLEYWMKLIEKVTSKNMRVLLSGSKGDKERLRAVFSENETLSIIAGQYSLMEMRNILREASCVVSVDTGIMHLAANVGARLIALHGPTSPLRWGGIGENVETIIPPLSYTPCISYGFEKKCAHPHCMRAITPDAVFERLQLCLK